MFVCQLLEAQADYHRRSLAALEAAIPTIQIQQGERHKIRRTLSESPSSDTKVNLCMSAFSYPTVVVETAATVAAKKCRLSCHGLFGPKGK